MKQSLSIVILGLSSLSALATELPTGVSSGSGSSCSWKLAKHAKVSAQVTGTLRNRVYARAAAFAAWWRNDKVPAVVKRAQKDLAQLEENLLHDDRLDLAIHQTKRHIEAVEFAYMIIKHHIHPMRKIFKEITTELSKVKDENLNEGEVVKLEEAFRGVSEHYSETNSYGRFSREGKGVESLRTLERLFTSDGTKEIPRKEVVALVKLVDGLLEAQEIDYAQDLGRHITTYEMLKSYMEAKYEERFLAYSIRTDNVDEIALARSSALMRAMPTNETLPALAAAVEANAEAAAAEGAPSTIIVDKAALMAARKVTWEQNIARLKSKVGWDAELKERFPDLGDAPSPALKDIKHYYNENPTARLSHNRRSYWIEARISLLTQIIDLTLIGAVVRPLVASVMSGPGKLRRFMNILREWSQKAQRDLILKDIQELVESSQTTLEKTADLAKYASDPRVGPYTLQLFASNSDLLSRVVWREIHNYTKQNDTYYPDLRKMMDTAQGLADKDGIPVAIQTSYWSPSQTTAVIVWILGAGYYNFHGEEDEELDKRVRRGFWNEVRDFFGAGPDADAEVQPGVQPAVQPDTLDPAANPAAAPAEIPAGEVAAPAPQEVAPAPAPQEGAPTPVPQVAPAEPTPQ